MMVDRIIRESCFLCLGTDGFKVGKNASAFIAHKTPRAIIQSTFCAQEAAVSAAPRSPRPPRLSNVTRSTALSTIRPIPRRGLSRDEAAMYVGISASKFDELVRDGRMPAPKRIDHRKVWDVRDLDLAFDALPSENPQSQGSSWDNFREL
jgi:excisionase family DNA binding protein